MEYANKKIGEASLNQKYVEINNRVYKDVKNYLTDKESFLSLRVTFSLIFILADKSRANLRQYYGDCGASNAITGTVMRPMLRDVEEDQGFYFQV